MIFGTEAAVDPSVKGRAERPQVVISDRFPGHDWIAVGDRRICCAHHMNEMFQDTPGSR